MSLLSETYDSMEEWFNRSVINSSDLGLDQISNVTVASDSHEPRQEGLLSDATARVIQTVVEVGILPGLMLAGVIMNIMSMAVFLRQGLSDRINLCLFSLAISDTGYILFTSTRLHSLTRLIDPVFADYWQFRCLSLVGIYVGFLTTSNCLTLLISLERCLLVISPLKARTMLPTRHMAIIIVLTFCTCLACVFPIGFKFDVISVTNPVTNATTYKPVFTRFFSNNRVAIDFLFEIFSAIVPSVAFTGVIIATCIIAVHMHAASAWRQKSASMTTAAEHREASVTRMLFVICVMYTTCSIPFIIRPLVVLLVYEFQPGMRYNNILFTSIALVHVIAIINCSFNFVIYYLMSTRFRNTFKELCNIVWVKKAAINSSIKTLGYAV